MEKWEYATTMVCASTEEKEVREYLKDRYKDRYKNLGLQKYSPEGMMPLLDQFGERGWELVHMQPVFLGKNEDVKFQGDTSGFSNWYFCAFKRRKQA